MDLLKKFKNRPLIVASLGGEPAGKLLGSARKAVHLGADLLEIRLDSLSVKDRKELPDLLKKLRSRAPLISTARAAREQGGGTGVFKMEESVRRSVLETALHDSDFLDIELNSPQGMTSIVQRAHRSGKKVILSYHDFKGVPDRRKIKQLTEKFKSLKGDVLKVAAMPATEDEAGKFMMSSLSLEGIRRVFIPMGNPGMVFRVFGYSFGSCMTYGFVAKAFAPGQIAVRELAEYRSLFYPEKP